MPRFGSGCASAWAVWGLLVPATARLEEDSLLGCKQRELTAREQLSEISIEGHEVLTTMGHGCRQPCIGQIVSNRMGKASCPLTSTVSEGRGDRRPAMRQQFFDAVGWVCGQSLEDVAQVLIRVVPVELGRLNQAHRSSRTLATA